MASVAMHRAVASRVGDSRAFHRSAWRTRYQRCPPLCSAAGSGGGDPTTSGREVFQGRFGAWSVEPADKLEVWAYRGSISVVAAAAIIASAPAFLPADHPASQPILAAMDPLTVLGAAGLGAALQLIHIYVAPLKRALQALWLAGSCGAAWVMLTHNEPAALFVLQHPWATWLVGPMFAALTGVAFKEGFCYGKWEAAGLFGTIPLLLLGHLTGLVNEEGQRGMLAAMVILLAVFAARKYTQPVAADIGDKSVFTYLAAPPEQQRAMVEAAAANGQLDA